MVVSPDPAISQPSTLTVEFITTRDEPRATLDIQLPQGIEILSGDLHWEGSLTAGQTQSHTIAIVVKEAGDLKIMALTNIPVSEKSSITDTDSIHIINEADRKTEVISDLNYTARNPKAKALKPPGKAMELAPLAAGDTITLSGRITYDATSMDGSTTYLHDQPLGRAYIILYDDVENTPIDRILDRALTSSDGQYSFTVSDIDDDVTFIDPYIEVYATDNERITVSPYADPIMVLIYYETLSIGSEVQTDKVTDFNIQGNNGQAMYIFDTLANVGYTALPWQSDAQVTVQWPRGCLYVSSNACYVYRTVYLTQDAGMKPDIMLHEYGHFVLDNYVFAWDITHACPVFSHDMFTTQNSSPTCAWSEGWATFYEMMVQNNANYDGYDLETPNPVDLAALTPKENSEMIVAASLWDIYDGAAEPFDVVQDSLDGPAHNGIWTVSTTNDPFTSAEFWQEWGQIRGKTCEVSAIFQNYGLQFDPFMYELTTQVTGSGSITPSPAPNCPQGTYLRNTSVTLNAQPSVGISFLNWSGDISGSANP